MLQALRLKDECGQETIQGYQNFQTLGELWENTGQAMQIANIVLSQWGPALLVCFTLVIGLIYQNARLTDFKDSMNRRFEAVDRRFEDLKDYLRSEFKRVDERIDRLESSLARK